MLKTNAKSRYLMIIDTNRVTVSDDNGTLLLDEPLVTKFNREEEKIYAVGDDAVNWANNGSGDEKCVIEKPFELGITTSLDISNSAMEIVNPVERMLTQNDMNFIFRFFIEKALGKCSYKGLRMEAVVPAMFSEEARNMISEALKYNGLDFAGFAELPEAIMRNKNIKSGKYNLTADMGCKVLDISVWSKEGTLSRKEDILGLDNLLRDVWNSVYKQCNLRLLGDAEEYVLKNALSGDIKLNELPGYDKYAGQLDKVKSEIINGEEVYAQMQKYLSNVKDELTSFMKQQPQNVLAEIKSNGLIVTGAVCKLLCFKEMLERQKETWGIDFSITAQNAPNEKEWLQISW